MKISRSFPYCQKDAIPALTADSTNVLKSSETDTDKAYYIFQKADGIIPFTDKWSAASLPAFIGYEFTERQFITDFAILPSVLYPYTINSPNKFSLEYSINGTDWVVIQSYDVEFVAGWNRFYVLDPFRFDAPYKYFRINVETVSNGTTVDIVRMKIFAREVSSTETKLVRQFCQDYINLPSRFYALNSTCKGSFDSADVAPLDYGIQEFNGITFFKLAYDDRITISAGEPLYQFIVNFKVKLSDDRRLLTTKSGTGTTGIDITYVGSTLFITENSSNIDSITFPNKTNIVYLSVVVKELELKVYIDGVLTTTMTLLNKIEESFIGFGQYWNHDDNVMDPSPSYEPMLLSEIYFSILSNSTNSYEILPALDLTDFYPDFTDFELQTTLNPNDIDLLGDNSATVGHWVFPKTDSNIMRIIPSPTDNLLCLEFGAGFTKTTTERIPTFPSGHIFDAYAPETPIKVIIDNSDPIITNSTTSSETNCVCAVNGEWKYEYDPTLGYNVFRKVSSSNISGLILKNIIPQFRNTDFTMCGYFYGSVITEDPHFGIFGNIGLDSNYGIGVGVKNGKFHLWGGTNSTTPIWLFASIIVSINTWYHIEISRSSGVTRLFVDGVKVLETSTAVDIMNKDFIIGGTYTTGGFSGYGDMRVADVSVYDIALHTVDFTPKSFRSSALDKLYFPVRKLKLDKVDGFGTILSSTVDVPLDGRVAHSLSGFYQHIDVSVENYGSVDFSNFPVLNSNITQSKTVDISTNSTTATAFTNRTNLNNRSVKANDGILTGDSSNVWYTNFSETQKFFMKFQNQKMVNNIDISLDNTITQTYRIMVDGSNDEISWDTITDIIQPFSVGVNSVPISPSIKYSIYRITILN